MLHYEPPQTKKYITIGLVSLVVLVMLFFIPVFYLELNKAKLNQSSLIQQQQLEKQKVQRELGKLREIREKTAEPSMTQEQIIQDMEKLKEERQQSGPVPSQEEIQKQLEELNK